MKQTIVLGLLGLLGTAACGGKAAQPAPSNVPTAPAVAPVELRLDGAIWTVTADGATVAPDGEYGVTVSTPAFALDVMPWPHSDAFVRTRTDHVAGLRESDPSLELLHDVDQGEGNFQVVVRTKGQLDGTVLVPGSPDDAMCGFKLDASADWRPALAACLSLTQPVDASDGDPEMGEGDLESGY